MNLPLSEECSRISRSSWMGGWIVALTAFVFRLGYFLELKDSPLPRWVAEKTAFDQYRFLYQAQEFLRGDWLGTQPTAHFQGYAYLVAGLHSFLPRTLETIWIFQMALGIGACVAVYASARLLFQSVWAGVFAGGLLAVTAPLVFYEGALLRAAPIAACNAFALLFLLRGVIEGRRGAFLLGGLCVGLSVVLRPNLLSLFVVPYLLLQSHWPWRRRGRFALFFIAGVILAAGPLLTRNALLQNRAGEVQGPRSSFWIGNAPDATGINFVPASQWRVLAEESKRHPLGSAGVFLGEVIRQPGLYARLYGRKLKMFLNAYEIPANLNFQFARRHSRWLPWGADCGLLVPLALVGLAVTRKRHRGVGLACGFLLVLSLSVVLFHVQGRYRIPALPLYALFAAIVPVQLFRWVQQGRWLGISLSAAALLALAWWCRPDQQIIRKYFDAPIRDIDYNNAGRAYVDAGRPEEGLEIFKEGLRVHPRAANLHNGAALTLVNLNKVEEAARRLERAITLGLSDPITYNNLGTIRARLGRREEAIGSFKEALRLDPQFHQARANLAGALYKTGRYEEALREYRVLPEEEAEWLTGIGLSLIALGRIGEAIEYLNRALDLDPRYMDAHNNLGVALAWQGKDAQAAASFRKALELQPDDASVRRNLNFVLQRLSGISAEPVPIEDAKTLVP